MAAPQRRRGGSMLEELLPSLLILKGLESGDISKKDAELSRALHGVQHERRPRTIPPRRPRRVSNAVVTQRITNGRPFRFFELPQEIRDEVYSHLVVRRTSRSLPILDATTILNDRKKRLAALKSRERLNQRRLSTGKRPVCPRTAEPEPLLHLELLRASQRLAGEATDCMYTNNWFAISLNKLPVPTYDIPHGWDLSRVKRLQVELQLKDAIRMNRYVDWASFFSALPSLQFLRIVPTLHPRYYEWSHPEFHEWSTTPFVHKAFFRELLAAIPAYVDLKIGLAMDNASDDVQMQGEVFLHRKYLWDMYAELGSRVDGAGRRIEVERIVS
ncbi:hypothetical protein J4E86_002876 [Alternaria arbusti]|uniref:uncharacterized protein n=1 Tax=Alternaria arbusti TaxID=232088 RepID=UPI00221EF212|nr:uncharacterized protein J4E86_002876 [Alternaria arbusti]KAI4959155.1 hypothetical protein J4E86_002876 [Alternaria arbusti]